MKLEGEKRKRISFAKDVECIENTSEAITTFKSKKTKHAHDNEAKELAEPKSMEETTTADSEDSDLWNGILAKSKSAGVNYEDAMKDFLVEKLRAVVGNPSDESTHADYAGFLNEMSIMFGKLHRYPKMISKFLFCIRTELVDAFQPTDSKGLSWIELLLPTTFLELLPSAISLLPISQTIDLWKTLHHNLEVECIKPLLDGSAKSSVKIFTGIVVELLAQFMSSIKVSESSVPLSQMEKICDLMSKIETDCLTKFGDLLNNQNEGIGLTNSFLKLAVTWAELEHMFQEYNPKYKVKEGRSLYSSGSSFSEKVLEALQESNAAFNLTFVHPYLTVQRWISLAEKAQESADSAAKHLLIKLVLQKAKRLRAVQLKLECSEPSSVPANLKKVIYDHLLSTASYLWLQQLYLTQECISTREIEEMLPLATETLESSDILELASKIVAKLDTSISLATYDASKKENSECGSRSLVTSSIGSNLLLCTSVLLQLTSEIVRRLAKMKLEKKYFKLLRSQTFSKDGQVEIFQSLVRDTSSNEISKYLEGVNGFLTEHEKIKATSNEEVEFSEESIQHLFELLLQLPIEEYPKEIKAFLCLFAVPVFISVTSAGSQHENVLRLAADLVYQSGWNARGSPTLFAVNWRILIKWLILNGQSLQVGDVQKILNVALSNIYVSAKCIEELDPILQSLSDSFKLDSSGSADVIIITGEFLIEELKLALASKSKLVAKIEENLGKIGASIEKELMSAPDFDASMIQPTDEGEIQDISTLSRTFRACCLLRKISAATAKEETEGKVVLEKAFPQQVEAALTFIRKIQKKKNLKKLVAQKPELAAARDLALEFLAGVCQNGGALQGCLPEDFVSRLWSYCCKADSSTAAVYTIVKFLYQLASVDEFTIIGNELVEEARVLATAQVPDGKSLCRVTNLVGQLIDADISPENKQIRWNVLEEYHLGYLNSTLHWKDYEDWHYFPVLDLQLKIIRRRNAICKLDNLAHGFISIQSTPLKSMDDITKFKKAFSKATDLLNAFIIHRIDVVSFRTHMVLQCFEYLVSSLTLKADQKNNLSNAEILDLRSCAHCIERVCQSTKIDSKEFARISPYFLAIMLRQVDVCVVYPAIKIPLMNGCYKLLDICDDHGVAQLNSMLSPGSREIFKVTYDLYKKYYRYTGKV